MKKYALYVGVDVSKTKLDVCFLTDQPQIKSEHFVITNDKKGFKVITQKLRKANIQPFDVLFCMENTGVYSMPLCLFCSDSNLDYWVVPAIEIKRSKGISRGKSDKTDAKDIALYALSHLHKLKLTKLSEKEIQKLKVLYTEREKVIKAIRLFDTTKESIDFLPAEITKGVVPINRRIIRELRKELKTLDKKIQNVIQENPNIYLQYKLIQSVPGVGPQTAVYLIMATKGFYSFENWRQLACYAGVAPFEYTSGSSIRGKTKVSHMADKKLKSLLNMCALSAKKYDSQIRQYYERKVKEGKNPMLVMNNLRCKILSRVFAVIKRQTPFIDTYKFAA